MEAFIDYLRNLPPDIGFDMKHDAQNRLYSSHPCGSACCLGGHAQLFLNQGSYIDSGNSISKALAEVTGIAYGEAANLCFPDEDSWAWNATVEDAIATLEHIAQHPKEVPQWKRAPSS